MTPSEVIDAMEELLREVWPQLNEGARHGLAARAADAYLRGVDAVPASVGRTELAGVLVRLVDDMIGH